MITFREFLKEYATEGLAPHGWILPSGEYVSVTQDYQTHSELLNHVIGKEWKGDKWLNALAKGLVRIVKDKHGFFLEYRIDKLSTEVKKKVREMVKEFFSGHLEINSYTTDETFRKVSYEGSTGLNQFLRVMK
jgi:hypothetical protein